MVKYFSYCVCAPQNDKKNSKFNNTTAAIFHLILNLNWIDGEFNLYIKDVDGVGEVDNVDKTWHLTVDKKSLHNQNLLLFISVLFNHSGILGNSGNPIS